MQLGTGNFLLVDYDEGRQDVDDLDSLRISVRRSGRLRCGQLETVSESLSKRDAYRELGVEAGDSGGDVAEALSDFLRPMSEHLGDI